MRNIRSIKKWNFTLMRSLGERAFGCGRWAKSSLRSESQIADFRSQICYLKFEICHPEGLVRSLTRAPLGELDGL